MAATCLGVLEPSQADMNNPHIMFTPTPLQEDAPRAAEESEPNPGGSRAEQVMEGKGLLPGLTWSKALERRMARGARGCEWL